MFDDLDDSIVVARVVEPYGAQGLIKVQAFTEKPDGLLHYEHWILDMPAKGKRLFRISDSRIHGKYITASLYGIETREQALALKGVEISVLKSSLQALPDGEYYQYQLLGLSVIDVDGTNYGIVDSIIETGANNVLRVKGESEHLIPYIPNVIVAIDESEGVLRVDWFYEY